MTPPDAVVGWEQRTDWPLSTVAMIFLVAYAIPIVNPATSQELKDLLEDVIVVAWVIFAGDYAARLWLSKGLPGPLTAKAGSRRGSLRFSACAPPCCQVRVG